MSSNLPNHSHVALLSTFVPADAARMLIQQFGSLREIACANPDELTQIPGIGPAKAQTLKSAFALSAQLSQETWHQKPLLDSPEKVAQLLREENRLYQVEQFQLALLNTRRRLIRVEMISKGTLDSILVTPREVFRSAIISRASALILIHNHPSGDPSPSDADITVTRDLVKAGKLLKIDVLDHIILGHCNASSSRDFVSLRELGYISS